jgi:hypothetical protein
MVRRPRHVGSLCTRRSDQHMSNDGWTGRAVERARTYVATLMLPGPCQQCGEMVTTDMPWNVGHITPRWQRPDLALDPNNWTPNTGAAQTAPDEPTN